VDSSPLHWWFGRGGPIDNLGSSSLYHCVPRFSNTGPMLAVVMRGVILPGSILAKIIAPVLSSWSVVLNVSVSNWMSVSNWTDFPGSCFVAWNSATAILVTYKAFA
jgi:hypothetical protein